jgi:peptidoglycan/LPS O-acetylase OafA/YrhL
MRKPELLGLTGIRFYAALLVYLSHVVEIIPGMGALGQSILLFNTGVVGVSFFSFSAGSF